MAIRQAVKRTAMAEMIRAGLAGYGLAGASFHASVIRASERMNLAAVLTSRDAPNRVGTLEEMLDRCDLVVVATPNTTHFEIAAAALNAGKHVVVDKPFALNVAEADELIALAEQRGRVLTVFHNRRWDSDFLTVRRILPQLGNIMLFEAHWDRCDSALCVALRQQVRSVPNSAMSPHQRYAG